MDLGRKMIFLAIFRPNSDRSDQKSGQNLFSLRLDEKSGQISASAVTKKSGQVFKKAKIPVPTSVGIIRGPNLRKSSRHVGDTRGAKFAGRQCGLCVAAQICRSRSSTTTVDSTTFQHGPVYANVHPLFSDILCKDPNDGATYVFALSDNFERSEST